jgi:hypothetical protein
MDIAALQAASGTFLLGRLAPWSDVAYHYTKPSGLLGILEEQVFYAGNSRHMNDPTEGQVGQNVWQDAVRARPLLAEALNTPEVCPRELDVFVASLSIHSDRLSQWRGYAAGGRGFALGIQWDSWAAAMF